MDGGILNAEQRTNFARDGFVNGGRILDDATVESLRTELDRVLTEHERTDIPQPVRVVNLAGNPETPVWQVVNIWMASPPYRDVMMRPDIGAAAAALLDADEIRIWHDQIQFKPQQTGGVNMWHQDWPYWGVLSEPDQVTAWVALDDVGDDNGCMSMVPGSHRWGKQIDFLHGLEDYDGMPATWEGHDLQVARCPVKKGEVHFHHGLTWHGSHANTSGRPRRAIAFHYMSNRTRYRASGEHPCGDLLGPEIADGDIMAGEFFPLIYRQSVPATA
jgi:ectoine hydroxylase-related dioxygenase (phytanoyl-CoA dioxygenase family)